VERIKSFSFITGSSGGSIQLKKEKTKNVEKITFPNNFINSSNIISPGYFYKSLFHTY
jgi:hypothetical protein